MNKLILILVHRGTRPDFQPGLLNLVARPTEPTCVDRTQLHYGGWINNRLEPATTNYYRVCAVDTAGQKRRFSRQAQVTTKP